MQKRTIPVLLAAALLISGLLSILSIHGLQGNARIINYTGVVRGATQRVVKQELNGQPNDAGIARLDGILHELATGEGGNGLSRLDDEDYQALVARMQDEWEVLKTEILRVRQGADGSELYRHSEDFFSLADSAVSAAEVYTERQVRSAERGLLALSGVILLLSAALAWYGARQAKRQQALQAAEEENRAKRAQLARMSEDLRAPMNELSELVYVSDLETRELVFLNRPGLETFGLPRLDGRKCYEILHGLDHPCEFCSTPYLVPGENYTWEHANLITRRHYLLKDRLIEWEGRPARLTVAFDVTEAEAEKQALKTTLDTEQMVMECVRTLYQDHDPAGSFPAVLERLGRFLPADRVYLTMVRSGQLYSDFEWSRGDGPQDSIIQGLSLSSLDRWRPIFDQEGFVVLEDVETIRFRHPEEYGLLTSHGIRSLVAAPMEQDGQLKGLLGVENPPPERVRSIVPMLQTLCYFLILTYRRTESEQQLSHLSYYDTLTSFYNRNRYMEDSAALAGRGGPVGIVYLDVNGLKDINDQQGHACGDRVLVECAQTMREVFGEADYYRIGGDEFVILCPGTDRADFERRVAALRRRFLPNDRCNAAIGARWDGQSDNLQQIIAQADAEMYEDKKDFYRRNPLSKRYRHLNDEVLHLSDPAVLQEELRQEHFVVYFQPKVASSDRSAVGAEALIRYQSRSGSLVLPGNFLPMLEESQTVSQIDFYVFEYVCSQLKEWNREGKQTLPVSVNFSRCSLSQPDFVKRLTGLCEKYGVESRYLEIELTETAREADGVDIRALLCGLRRAGFTVSIDDFGTEYANLSLLSNVEFDVLKLDKSMVDDVAVNARAREVIRSTASVCRGMGIQVVAEGIETEEQLGALRECGVELAQGFLFSKPIPIAEYQERYL